MIYCMVGTHEEQFDRLIKAVDALDTSEDRIVQYGHSSYLPRHCTAEQFLPFETVRRYIEQAAVVITHSGTGSVMLSLSMGKRPIVAPRYKRYGEHVDDHQLELVEQLVKDDLVIPYYDGDNLATRVQEALSSNSSHRSIEPDERLLQDLREFIDSVC